MMEPMYSEKGSTKRAQEEQTYVHFCDFLDQCEGKIMQLHVLFIYYSVNFSYIVEDEIHCQLEDIVVFFSGADRPPPLGFIMKPQLQFLDRDAR